MIYTKFGNKVTIIKGNVALNECTISYDDGKHKKVLLTDLRADNGINKIDKALIAINFED